MYHPPKPAALFQDIMTKDEGFKLLKIQTCVLRVNIDCDGCKLKVRKLLQKIEGVYSVSIDAEQQRVTVSGTVEPATLIKRLARSGKHAELWSGRNSTQLNQNQKQKNNCIMTNNGEDNKGQKRREAFKNQQKLPAFSLEEGFDCIESDVLDDDLEDEGMRYTRERAKQLGLQFRQQASAAANHGKKNAAAAGMMSANVPSDGGNKGNHVQNGSAVMKPISGEGTMVDPMTMASASLKMLNPHLSMSHGDARMGASLPVYQGNNNGNIAAPGGKLSGYGALQAQQNHGFPINNAMATGNHPSSMMMNMNAYSHPSSSMLMNIAAMQQRPQQMYHITPSIPPATGYYYNPSPYSYMEANYSHHPSQNTAAHMFSDENTSSCCIM